MEDTRGSSITTILFQQLSSYEWVREYHPLENNTFCMDVCTAWMCMAGSAIGHGIGIHVIGACLYHVLSRPSRNRMDIWQGLLGVGQETS